MDILYSVIKSLRDISNELQATALDEKSPRGSRNSKGHWVTTRTGAHIFIDESNAKGAPHHGGQSKEEKAVLQLFYVPAREGYSWNTPGVIRIGKDKDIAACVDGDFKGKCVIYCHGQGGNAISGKYAFAPLVKSGISFITPDYRGVGKTSGEFTEDGLYEAAHSAYDWLRNVKHVKPKDIFVLGYSLGSGPAAELASTSELGGCILQTPFSSAAEQVKHLQETNKFVRMMAMPQDIKMCQNYKAAGKIRCPALVFHGTDDHTVPYAHGKKVFDSLASKDKEMVSVKGGDHCTFQNVMGLDRYYGKLYNFINKQPERKKTNGK